MIASLAPVDILAVFAHPDYETFASGTFTKLSANGQRIQLVYATSGHAGGDLTGQGLTM
jgi:LmbE family N-acetylglucosaminyl deacetylase